MTLSEKQFIFTKNVALLINKIYEQGYTASLAEAYRTPEQAELNAKRGTGIKDSLHCKRLAIDINLFKDGKYLTDTASHKPFGEYWATLHPLNRWGGTFKPLVDGNHYQMSD